MKLESTAIIAGTQDVRQETQLRTAPSERDDHLDPDEEEGLLAVSPSDLLKQDSADGDDERSDPQQRKPNGPNGAGSEKTRTAVAKEAAEESDQSKGLSKLQLVQVG